MIPARFEPTTCGLRSQERRSQRTWRQQDAIDYLREENRALHEMLAGAAPAHNAQRKRLAIRGQALGRALLEGITMLVQPDTILD